MLSTLPLLPMLSIDAKLPTLSSDAELATLSTLANDRIDHRLRELNRLEFMTTPFELLGCKRRTCRASAC